MIIINVLTAGAVCFVFHFFFSFIKNTFSSRNLRQVRSVQRRAAVKGAARPRSSQTLYGEHRWRTLSLKGAGEVEKKWGEEKRIQLGTPDNRTDRERGGKPKRLAASGATGGNWAQTVPLVSLAKHLWNVQARFAVR
jgi:hypothetical protein